MKRIACIALTICGLGSTAYPQVGPAARGSSVASAARQLQYAFRYAQNAQLSNHYSNQQTSVVSGSLSYENGSQTKPFSMNYAGGYTWTLSGPDYQTGQFHRLYLSQGANTRRWNFNLADNVGYLPQAPTTGFSGIPGIGEPIGSGNPLTSTNQSILTLNTHVVSNSAMASVGRTLDYATSLVVGGNSDYMYFPDANGIDTRTTSGNVGIDRRISARTSLLSRYQYSLYQYPSTTVSMRTQTALGGFRRRVSRNLDLDVSGGPQWIDSSVQSVVPAMTNFELNAFMRYLLRSSSFGAIYFHGTNGGGGYLIGGTLDSAQGNYLHHFGPNFVLGITGGYQRTAAFNNKGVTNGVYGGTQGTWWLGSRMIVFANYTGTSQSSSSQLPGNVLNDMYNTISFGFGFSSREPRVRP
jgi:hypothetical protein